MQDVFVSTDKISYLFECLKRYNGSTGFLVLYFAALVFILLRGTDKEKKIFIPMSVLMLITVYNPLFPLVLSKFADINSEYYRFFWMTPVLILVPYVITIIIISMLNGEIKHKKSILILMIIVFAFSSDYIYRDGICLPENIYKVPDEMIEVSELIHSDSEDEYPKAFLEYEYNMQMRQYDGKMLLTIDREDYLYAISSPYTDEMINDDQFPQYRMLAAFVRYQMVDRQKLLEAFDLTGTEYIVLTTGSTWIPPLEQEGLKVVGKTEHNTILKYELKDKTPFTLVDYSEVYEEGY